VHYALAKRSRHLNSIVLKSLTHPVVVRFKADFAVDIIYSVVQKPLGSQV
jgi:hypothetical protein